MKAEGDLALTIEGFTRSDGTSTIGVPCWKGEGILNNHCVLVVPRDDRTHPRFAQYAHASAPVLDALKAGGVGAIAASAAPVLRSLTMPVSSLGTQALIAEFLDREAGRIDGLVAAKRRMIDLLEEERTALITHTVTKGLDPTVPMKDSGIPWLGEIPAHWEVAALRRFSRLKSGDAITEMDFVAEGAYPVFGGNGVRGRAGSYTHQGDFVLIGRQGALCGNVNLASGRFFASEHAVVVDSRLGPPVWLGEVLRTMNLNQYSKAAAQPGLSVDVIAGLAVPIPPLPERGAIADFTLSDSRRRDRLSAAITTQLTLLQEYRQALITAAVTGRLSEAVLKGEVRVDEALEDVSTEPLGVSA